MITCHKKHLEERCLERGYELAEVIPCVVSMDGDTWTVDVDHPSYPHPKSERITAQSFICVPDCTFPEFACGSNFCCEENILDGTNKCVQCPSSSSSSSSTTCGDCYPDRLSLTLNNINVIEHPFDGPLQGDGECIDAWENVVLYNNQGGSALNTTLNSLDYRAVNGNPITLERSGCGTSWSGSVNLPEQFFFAGGGTSYGGCREVEVGVNVSITTAERQVLCLLAGGSGSGAYAEASVVGGGIPSISLIDGGSGYAYRQNINVTVTDTPYVSIWGDGSGATATATVITTPGPNYGDVAVTITNGGSDYTYAQISIEGYNQYGWDCWGGSSSGDAVITDGAVTGYSGSGWFSPFIRTCSVPEGDIVVEAPTVIITGTGSGVVANALVDADPNSPDFGKVTSVNVSSPGQGFETGLFSYLSISMGLLRLKANWEQNCNLPVEGLPCQQPTGVYTTTDPCAVSLFKQYDLVWGSRYSSGANPVECPNASNCHWSTFYTTATAAYPDTGMGQMTANITIA